MREAYDTQERRKCAVKIYNKRKLSKLMTGELEKVEKELEILKKVFHPNCISFLDSFESEEKGKFYLFVEYVAGGNLDTLVKNNKCSLPVKQARR